MSGRIRVGVIRADQVAPDLARRHGEYPDMVRALLREAAAEVECRAWDATVGELPGPSDESQGYVISGSRHSVTDDQPWIRGLEDWVRGAVAAGRKIVAICFGHQLVAQALGGGVGRSPHGWTVGVQVCEIASPFPWADPARRRIRLIHSHQDQVLRLPPGAERVGGSELCPLAFYRIGERVMSLQGHPEFPAAYARALYERRREALGEERLAAAVASLERGDDRLEAARWIVAFLARGGGEGGPRSHG